MAAGLTGEMERLMSCHLKSALQICQLDQYIKNLDARIILATNRHNTKGIALYMVRKNIAENMREVYQHYQYKKAEELQMLAASLSLPNDLLDDEANTDMDDPSENDAEDLILDVDNESVLLEIHEADDDEISDLSGRVDLGNTNTYNCDSHLVNIQTIGACSSAQSLDVESASLCENIVHGTNTILNTMKNAFVREELMDTEVSLEIMTDSAECLITGVIINSEGNGDKYNGGRSHLPDAENADMVEYPGAAWNVQSGSDHESTDHPNTRHTSSSSYSISDNVCPADMHQSQYPEHIAHRNNEISEGYLDLTGTAISDLNTISDTESFIEAEEEIIHNSSDDEGLNISGDGLAIEEGLEANCKTLSQVLVTEMIAIPQRQF